MAFVLELIPLTENWLRLNPTLERICRKILTSTGNSMIIDKTLEDIIRLKGIDGIHIEDLAVAAPFTTVLLNDGSVGSAGNYDVQNQTPGYNPVQFRRDMLRAIPHDPLLLETLVIRPSLAALSLKVAIL